MMGLPLPQTITLQGMLGDTPGISFRPEHWLQPAPRVDYQTWLGAPMALLIPSGLYQQFGQRFTQEETILGYDSVTAVSDDWNSALAVKLTDHNMVALGPNPSHLERIEEEMKQQPSSELWQESPVAGDIFLWFDAERGYHLYRKLLQTAVQNRTVASWRRHSRQFRIARQLGLAKQVRHQPQEPVVGLPWFPTEPSAAAIDVHRIPPMAHLPHHRYRGSRHSDAGFDGLPTPLLDLLSGNITISIEPDTLIFETRLTFFAEPVDTLPNNEAAEPTPPTLDFDSE